MTTVRSIIIAIALAVAVLCGLFMLAGCGTVNSIMVGVNGRWVEVADGDTVELAVPPDEPLTLFLVKCPPGNAGCAVELHDAPVEATTGTTRLTGRTIDGGGDLLFYFAVHVTVRRAAA